MKSINPQGKDPGERVFIIFVIIVIIIVLYLKICTPYFD